MKLHLFLSASMLILVLAATAQNNSPYWSLAGNSNASTSSKLGTTNSVPLRLLTNNVERMRITTTGKVGIGTTSPAALLDVRSTANGLLARFNGGTSNMYLGLFENSVGRGYLGSYSGNNEDVDFGTSTNNTTGKVHLTIKAVPKLTVASDGNVGIGTTTPAYKLQVVGGSNIAISGNSTYLGVYGSGTTYGVYGSGNSGVFGSGSTYGVYGSGSTYGLYGSGGTYGLYSSGSNYGVYGYTSGNYGVYGVSNYVGVYGTGTSYGLNGQGGTYGVAGDGSYIGVFGSGGSYAVVGNSNSGQGGNFHSVSGTALVAGTDRSDKNWAAIFNGNTYAYGSYLGSDQKLKKNIENVPDALTLISKLKPHKYEFITDGNLAVLHLPQGKHYGLIAQELEQVLPDLVKEVNYEGPVSAAPAKVPLQESNSSLPAPTTSEKITSKAINYIELIPIIIKGMQEQKEENEVLKDQVVDQQKQIAELRQMVLELKGSTGILTATGAYLEQNTPNPVSGTTTIRYHLPETTTSARLALTNAKGQLVKSMSLTDKGTSQVNLNTSALAAGTYNYTLYVDGKQVDTKRLVITR